MRQITDQEVKISQSILSALLRMYRFPMLFLMIPTAIFDQTASFANIHYPVIGTCVIYISLQSLHAVTRCPTTHILQRFVYLSTSFPSVLSQRHNLPIQFYFIMHALPDTDFGELALDFVFKLQILCEQ